MRQNRLPIVRLNLITKVMAFLWTIMVEIVFSSILWHLKLFQIDFQSAAIRFQNI